MFEQVKLRLIGIIAVFPLFVLEIKTVDKLKVIIAQQTSTGQVVYKSIVTFPINLEISAILYIVTFTLLEERCPGCV